MAVCLRGSWGLSSAIISGRKAEAEPGEPDLITQRIEALEGAAGLDQEMNRELLLLTAKPVRELEGQVAEIVRAIRERGTEMSE